MSRCRRSSRGRPASNVHARGGAQRALAAVANSGVTLVSYRHILGPRGHLAVRRLLPLTVVAIIRTRPASKRRAEA